MLIRFEVSNYRSILEPAELSMVAIDQDRPEARPANLLGESLLTVAAIFGPNASGKSNVISALSWIRDAVRESLRFWENEIPVEPFAFGDGPATTSEFVVELLIRDVRFEYAVELDQNGVHYEGLFHYPEKKKRRIFEREERELKLQRGLGSISGTRELLTDYTLALSAARRFDEPLVVEFVRELFEAQFMGPSPYRSRFGLGYRGPGRFPITTRRLFEDPNPQAALFPAPDEITDQDRAQALALLRLADLGVVDVLIDEEEVRIGQTGTTGSTRPQKRVRLVHRSAGARLPLDYIAESEGTKTWFRVIGPVLSSLKLGSLLVFDELEASLHPTLSAQLIKLFHDPATNPLGAQIIFTSHDTSLLNHLNRDEVWLTDKSDIGATRLGALAEFAGERVRKSVNLESAYLHGRFGALPDLDRTEFLRSLGLIG